jgi:hypothetical protein
MAPTVMSSGEKKAKKTAAVPGPRRERLGAPTPFQTACHCGILAHVEDISENIGMETWHFLISLFRYMLYI